jgi:hypothetical protein
VGSPGRATDTVDSSKQIAKVEVFQLADVAIGSRECLAIERLDASCHKLDLLGCCW